MAQQNTHCMWKIRKGLHYSVNSEPSEVDYDAAKHTYVDVRRTG
jgi:hypothetical protein